jgi:hypothetical protein
MYPVCLHVLRKMLDCIPGAGHLAGPCVHMDIVLFQSMQFSPVGFPWEFDAVRDFCCSFDLTCFLISLSQMSAHLRR